MASSLDQVTLPAGSQILADKKGMVHPITVNYYAREVDVVVSNVRPTSIGPSLSAQNATTG
jgi:hypothetical protein